MIQKNSGGTKDKFVFISIFIIGILILFLSSKIGIEQVLCNILGALGTLISLMALLLFYADRYFKRC